MAEQKETSYIEINIFDILKLFLKRWYFILLAGLIAALGAFAYKYTQVEREYKSSALVYVNNSSISSVSDVIKGISYSDIQASKSLVDVYSIITKARTQLTLVLNCLQEDYGIVYTYEQLNGMVTVSSVNETEIVEVSAQGKVKEDVIAIANAVADVMADKIDEIIIGSKVKIVDRAQVASSIAKGTVKSTAVGGLIGIVLACGALFVLYLLNNSIESEEWVRKTFGDSIPLLSVIPNSTESSSKKYGYKKYGYRKYYQSNHYDNSNK